VIALALILAAFALGIAVTVQIREHRWRNRRSLGSFEPSPPTPVRASVEDQPPTDFDG
jgi:hypothetical protein